MRYRLIPARPVARTQTLHLDSDVHALNAGEGFSESIGVRVLVCACPEGGLVRSLELVGETPPERAKR